MKSSHELKHLFCDKEFIGEVLRSSTLLESELDVLLSLFFCRRKRMKESLERLMPELNFNSKIEILAAIEIRKKTKSYCIAIGRLRSFRRLRNLVAHQWVTTAVEVEKLCKNKEITAMLDGYPETMKAEFACCRRALWRLMRTREFRLEDGKSLDDMERFDLIYRKVFG